MWPDQFSSDFNEFVQIVMDRFIKTNLRGVAKPLSTTILFNALELKIWFVCGKYQSARVFPNVNTPMYKMTPDTVHNQNSGCGC